MLCIRIIMRLAPRVHVVLIIKRKYLCTFGNESKKRVSRELERVTHGLYICYMTMSCICLSIIKSYVMLCHVGFCHSTG